MPWFAILALAAGTYLFRIVGPVFRNRIRIPARVEQLLSDASVVLLVALVANSTLISGAGFAGWARVIGVSVGGGLAVLNLPPVRQLIARRFARVGSSTSSGATSVAPGSEHRSRRRPPHIPFPVIIIAAAVAAGVLRLLGLH